MVGTKPKEDENGEGKREEEKTRGLKIQGSINGIFVTFRLSNVERAKVGTEREIVWKTKRFVKLQS